MTLLVSFENAEEHEPALWQFLVWLAEIQVYLPAPSSAAAEIISERAVIFSQLRVTLFEIFAGYLLAFNIRLRFRPSRLLQLSS